MSNFQQIKQNNDDEHHDDAEAHDLPAHQLFEKKCDITWKNLSYSVVTRDFANPDPKAPKVKRTIIDRVSGFAMAGQCLAILGSSGAGKTTFLNTLAGRVVLDDTKTIEGDVCFNGKRLDFDKIADLVGFVMQNDIFLEFMTPVETLMFGASLRFDISKEKKMKKVNRIIKDLKLERARDTLIGGQLLKGISGGEKKRVNIGFELISEPQVLFLDEPTSGLDSYTSYIIISQLQRLAERDMRTI